MSQQRGPPAVEPVSGAWQLSLPAVLQTIEQPPQLLLSTTAFTQVPAQLVWPAGQQTELPVVLDGVQAGVLPVHVVPHAAQLLLSSAVSTQLPPQQVSLTPLHDSAVGCPAHAPQFASSVLRSTHVPLQFV